MTEYSITATIIGTDGPLIRCIDDSGARWEFVARSEFQPRILMWRRGDSVSFRKRGPGASWAYWVGTRSRQGGGDEAAHFDMKVGDSDA